MVFHRAIPAFDITNCNILGLYNRGKL